MSSVRFETCGLWWETVISVKVKEWHGCTYFQQTACRLFASMKLFLEEINRWSWMWNSQVLLNQFPCWQTEEDCIVWISGHYSLGFNYKPVAVVSPQVHDPMEMYASAWVDSTVFVLKHICMLTVVLQPGYFFCFFNNYRSTSLRNWTSQRAVIMSRWLFDAGLLMNERKLRATKWRST